MKLQLGIDNFLNNHIQKIKGLRVGLLAHGASVTHDLRWTPQVLAEHPQVNLVKLFGPEHGLFGTAQDMEGVQSSTDSITGLPVVSLYGSNLESIKPKIADLKDIDVFICDLQDVGSRYYTYVYTMAFCMQSCAQLGIPVMVLDRPNPLGGDAVEGNLLDLKFRSFVGWYSLPVRHGMTIGELAQYWNRTEGWRCDLTVIPIKYWKRFYTFDQTGLTFVPPSPNMPSLDTAFVYPGMCLIEATQLSEGRGTTKPFQWIGAPYIKAAQLTKELNRLALPGVYFRPYHFKPSFQKLAGQECCGVDIHVTDKKLFRPFLTGLRFIQTLIRLYPDDFKWRDAAYEFVKDIPAIDLLTGTDRFRTRLHEDGFLESWLQKCERDSAQFKEIRREYLLY